MPTCTPEISVRVELLCTYCDEPMADLGYIEVADGRPLHPHRCPNGHQEYLERTYPRVERRPRGAA